MPSWRNSKTCYCQDTPLFAFPFPITLLYFMTDFSLDFYIKTRVVSCPFSHLVLKQFKQHKWIKTTLLCTQSLLASSTVASPLALTMPLTPTRNAAVNVIFQTRCIFIFFLSHRRWDSCLFHTPSEHCLKTTTLSQCLQGLSHQYQAYSVD